jgi:LysM repeat protein
MGFWHRIIFTACAVSIGVVLGGCEPSAQSAADDEREPHYVLGQNRINAMDYPGAVEAFEASLEANPHSAAAHYQLGMIYSGMVSNPAAAIYHYQEYLRFDPKAGNAEVVTGRIYTCKLQLAQGLLELPSSSTAIQQLQQLTDKNRQLQEDVDKYRAYFDSQKAAVKTNLPPAPVKVALQPAATVVANPQPAAQPRTHSVAAGETPAAVARKYGVNLNALMAANPGLNPKKLRVGQVINLPPP